MKNKVFYVLIGFVFLLFGIASSAQAIPSLQLYLPDGEYSYALDQTWVIEKSASPFTLTAFALDQEYGSGAGDAFYDRTYQLGTNAVLSISLYGDFDGTEDSSSFGTLGITGGSGTLGDWAYGNAPISTETVDEYGNTMPPHGIFPTWYSLYNFTFDPYGAGVFDVQPPEGQALDTTPKDVGFREDFTIDLSGLGGDLDVHFDLFTEWTNSEGTTYVYKFAPFSHDARTVPEPATMLLLGSGLILMAGIGRKKFKI
jgi:hypothetical protein